MHLARVLQIFVSLVCQLNKADQPVESQQNRQIFAVSVLIARNRVQHRYLRPYHERNYSSTAFSIDWSRGKKSSSGSYFCILLLLSGDIEQNPGPGNEDQTQHTCPVCDRVFSYKSAMDRHISSKHEGTVVQCTACGEEFNRKDNLTRHLKRKICVRNQLVREKQRKTEAEASNAPSTSQYETCLGLNHSTVNPSTDSTRSRLEASAQTTSTDPPIASSHPSIQQSFTELTASNNTDMQNSDERTIPSCSNQDERFPDNVESLSNIDVGADPEIQSNNSPVISLQLKKQAFGGKAKIYEVRFLTEIRDPLMALEHTTREAQKLCNDMLDSFKGIKFCICLTIKFFKALEPAVTSDAHFWCKQKIILRSETVEDDIISCIPKIISSIEEYTQKGSGWVIAKILKADLHLTLYEPLSGRCHTALPRILKNKKAILNIRNADDKCFMWCILAKLHPARHNPNRVQNYYQFEAMLNCDGVDFPMTLAKIPKFEKNNNLSINVYGFEDVLYPLYISERSTDPTHHIDLLLYDDHYFLVRDLDRLLSTVRGGNRKKHFCHRCLFPFYSRDKLSEHISFCIKNEPTRIIPPEQDFLQFQNIQKTIHQPIVIYADFECFTSPVQDESTGNTEIYQQHIPASFGTMKVLNCCGKPQYDKVQLYRDEQPVKTFLESLIETATDHDEHLSQPTAMVLSVEEQALFENADKCNICQDGLGDDRVRDHCHMCGQFRGATHNKCNQLLRLNRNIVVVFHNLRRYDGHLIMQEIGSISKLYDLRLDVVAKSMEDYLGFTLNSISQEGAGDIGMRKKSWKIRFIDSCQFLPASLSGLMESMQDDDFIALKQEFEDITLLRRKGVFPYDAMQDRSFFSRSSLPQKSEFYNQLNQTNVSDEDYTHAETIWSTYNMTSMGDYHDFYLKCDVIGLADIMENFRKLCMHNYGLDPVHYLTLPSLAFDACFKISGVKLQTLCDPDMYAFFEKGIRGGISVVSHRYAKANNPMCPGFDKSQPHSFIMYLDMNNLYGTAMSYMLPKDGFRWMTKTEIENTDFLNVANDSNTGYVLEVDLEYPADLHSIHNDYPLAPEKMTVDDGNLSTYCKQLKEEISSASCQTKLIPNLHDKNRYVLHYQNLLFYISQGLVLKKIHRVIQFKQSKWLQTYIDINTRLRTQARSLFEKDLFKLMNNAVFGKTMENVRAYKEIIMATSERQFRKLVNSPRFKRLAIFTEDLVGVAMCRKSTCLNKPIYAGFSVLDISKLLMFQFHYKHMIPKYGVNCRLLFTDTDSFIYHITTSDIYHDMKTDEDKYDTSDYPSNHFLHSLVNCKVLGKMKDETKGVPISEFVGLRAKMYAFRAECGEHKRAKGVKKNVVKSNIHFTDYYNCLFSKQLYRHKMNMIKSNLHQIYSVVQQKYTLSPYDDKRYILDDGITTLAYGHHSIIRTAGEQQDVINEI